MFLFKSIKNKIKLSERYIFRVGCIYGFYILNWFLIIVLTQHERYIIVYVFISHFVVIWSQCILVLKYHAISIYCTNPWITYYNLWFEHNQSRIFTSCNRHSTAPQSWSILTMEKSVHHVYNVTGPNYNSSVCSGSVYFSHDPPLKASFVIFWCSNLFIHAKECDHDRTR